jgi:hypothetical protein
MDRRAGAELIHLFLPWRGAGRGRAPSRKRVFRPDQPVITHVFVDGDPHLDGDAPYSR